MSTFQAILYSVLSALTDYLPLGLGAHLHLASEVLHWELPQGRLLSVMTWGSVGALLFHFRHDWSSIISCFLQVLIYRKKPMTLDERLPFFLFLTSLPLALALFYLQGEIPEAFKSPLWIGVGLFVSCLWLSFVASYSKKNKGMFDWNVVDSIILGVAHVGVLLPGVGRPLSLIGAGLSRNYAFEPTVKYSLYAALPFLVLRAVQNWKLPSEASTLTLAIAGVVSFIAALVAIGGIQKSAQKGSLRAYVIYGILVSSALIAHQFLRV